jgi:sigma-E factor negative regulatory protein RseC
VQETVTLVARNAIGARPGDLVVIESRSGPVLAAAAVLYVLPLVLFFAGYLLGSLQWGKGALCGCIAFALGIAVSVLYDRVAAKKKKTEYTITGYAQVDLHGF